MKYVGFKVKFLQLFLCKTLILHPCKIHPLVHIQQGRRTISNIFRHEEGEWRDR